MGKLSGLIAEATRRRVFRTGGLYVVGAWVLLQVADLGLESLALPDSLLRYFWAAAFIGFPIALVFGWYYEITAQGIRKTASAAGIPGTQPQMEVPDYVIIVAVAIVVGIVAAGLFDRARQATELDGEYDPRGIAVLPLDNLSGDEGQDYVAAGIHDALITNLSKIKGLRVVSRTSAVRLDRTLAMSTIGERLGVRNIIEGSVTREGNRVRVIIQLIDATADAHIWAENFERDFTSVLGLQNDMARAIADAVDIQLSDDEQAMLSAVRPVDPEIYDRYLRAMYLLNQGSNRIRQRGITMLEEIVDAGAADAHVYAALAYGYAVLGHSPYPEGMYPASRLAAQKAMELDDSIAEVHLALGMHSLYYEWNFAAAESSLRRALEINPNLTGAAYHLAWLMELYRDSGRALPPGELTAELDPLSPLMAAYLAEQYRSAGQYDRAFELGQQALDLGPGNAVAHYTLAMSHATLGNFETALEHSSAIIDSQFWGFSHGIVLAAAGRVEEARDVLADIDKSPRNVVSLILLYSALGEVDEAFRWMIIARDIRLPWYPWFITWFPFMDEVRADPRMDKLAQELELTEALSRARSAPTRALVAAVARTAASRSAPSVP